MISGCCCCCRKAMSFDAPLCPLCYFYTNFWWSKSIGRTQLKVKREGIKEKQTNKQTKYGKTFPRNETLKTEKSEIERNEKKLDSNLSQMPTEHYLYLCTFHWLHNNELDSICICIYSRVEDDESLNECREIAIRLSRDAFTRPSWHGVHHRYNHLFLFPFFKERKRKRKREKERENQNQNQQQRRQFDQLNRINGGKWMRITLTAPTRSRFCRNSRIRCWIARGSWKDPKWRADSFRSCRFHSVLGNDHTNKKLAFT